MRFSIGRLARDRSDSGPGRFTTAVFFGSLLIMAMVTAFAGAAMLRQDREQAWILAGNDADNILTTVSQDIARNFELYDLSLQGVLEGLAQPDIWQLRPAIRNSVLFDRSTSATDVGSIYVVDADGHIILTSRSSEPVSIDVSDRDYFIRQKQDPQLGLYISHPLQGRMQHGTWSIAMSRRFNRPDGSFGGIAAMTINLDYFDHLLARLSLPGDSGISIHLADGTLLMRHPLVADNIGRSYTDVANWQRAEGQASGTFVARSVQAGGKGQRLIGFQRVSGLPLILWVGQPVDQIMQGWRHRLWSTVLVIGSLSIVMLYLAVMLEREFRRRNAVQQQLRVLSTTDGLTGIANRRAFDDRLTTQWQHARRNGKPLSLVMLDIDHFKAFNDTYGHPAGDACLQEVAAIVRAAAKRPTDLPARFGGEEFALLLPDTDAAGAWKVACRIRAGLRSAALVHVPNDSGFVTASFGTATLQPNPTTLPATLIARADAALYAAKAAGRDRVVSDAGSGPTPALALTH